MGYEFFETRMGKQFFNETAPGMVSAAERIADAMEQEGWRGPVAKMLVTHKGRQVLLEQLLLACQKAGEIKEYESLPNGEIPEARLMDSHFVIHVIKSRETDRGVIFFGAGRKHHVDK